MERGVTDWVNQHLKATRKMETTTGGYTFQRIREKAKCVSGLEISIQASDGHYCTPRVTDAPLYTHVEVGFPPYRIAQLMAFAEDREKPTETVYGWVPIHIMNDIIDAHGGLIDGT